MGLAMFVRRRIIKALHIELGFSIGSFYTRQK